MKAYVIMFNETPRFVMFDEDSVESKIAELKEEYLAKLISWFGREYVNNHPCMRVGWHYEVVEAQCL